MEKENKKIENEVTQEEYQTIEPDDIVLDDDSDMPEPQTKSYEKFMKCTDKFMELFHNVISTLPYASIKLIDLVKYMETKKDCIPINEIDKVISFIANIEFSKARPLMELMESAETQSQLFQIIQ